MSTKTKGKLIVAEKVQVPLEILDKVKADIENFEDGLESITYEKLKPIIDEMYIKEQRKKLAGHWENTKMKVNFTSLHKILIHLAYNIGPSKQTNEDIDEIKEDGAESNQSAEEDFDINGSPSPLTMQRQPTQLKDDGSPNIVLNSTIAENENE